VCGLAEIAPRVYRYRPRRSDDDALRAWEIINRWRNDYNGNRPHTSLDGLTPLEFVAKVNHDQNQNRANL
jgi:hypothetical protein